MHALTAARSSRSARGSLAALAWAGVALALVGCGGPRPAARGAPARGAGEDGFPVTLVDARGVAVTVSRRPERIVSAAPTVTEILFAIGAGERVVAVTDQCDYPPALEGLPRIGGWFTPSAERTLAARPDVVVTSRGSPPEFLDTIRKSGCPVFAVDPRTLEDIYRAIRDIGAIVGAAEGAEQVVHEVQARLGAVADLLSGVPQSERPTVFLFLQLNPVWTAGARTFQHDALEAAGARNVAADREGFTPYSTESLLAADPEFLVLSTMGGDLERMRRELLANPALRRLSAAREGRIIVLDADPLMRPGPRIAEAVEALAAALYPGLLVSPERPSSSETSER